jgi:hypothetical protein
MEFLTAFDQDVEFIAKPRQKDGPLGSIRFRRFDALEGGACTACAQ